MRYAGCTVVAALLLALTPFAAWAGKLHVTCTDGVSAAFDDGSVTCDVDGASDGVCTLAFCRSLDEVRRFCATVVPGVRVEAEAEAEGAEAVEGVQAQAPQGRPELRTADLA